MLMSVLGGMSESERQLYRVRTRLWLLSWELSQVRGRA